jgi:hypothetical protein
MTDPTTRFEREPITEGEVIQLFIVASDNREALENPGPLFEAARTKFIEWVDQEQALVGGSPAAQLAFDVRRINVAIRGGMKEYAAGELADLELRIQQEPGLAELAVRFRGDLDRFRLEVG